MKKATTTGEKNLKSRGQKMLDRHQSSHANSDDSIRDNKKTTPEDGYPAPKEEDAQYKIQDEFIDRDNNKSRNTAPEKEE